MRTKLLFRAILNKHAMRSAEIVRSIEAEFQPSRRIGFRLRNFFRGFFPPLAAQPIPHYMRPVQFVNFPGLKSLPANFHWLANTGEMRCGDQLALRWQYTDDLLRL